MDALTNAMRRLGRTIPGVPQTYHLLRHWYVRYKSRNLDPAAEFAAIFHAGAWGGKDSVSGPGSEPDQTGVLLRELPALFRELQVSTVLDLPCGDFHWMRDVDLSGVAYTGGDIVEEIIQRNWERYRRDNVVFQRLDLLGDDLPPADLVICRDCLVHFSFVDTFRALQNICRSNSTYLLTTTFPARQRNTDILTGHWRPLNLAASPFRLPAPLLIINEGCTEVNGEYADKSLGLWRVDDLREALVKRGKWIGWERAAVLTRGGLSSSRARA
jgi:SAM-dependent methyltransferase